MKDVRYFVGVVGVFVLLVMLVAGCAQTLVCAPPNSIIGSKCCLDADDNSVCDAEEEKTEEDIKIVKPVEEEEDEEDEVSEEQSAIASFADIFESTWNRKSSIASKVTMPDRRAISTPARYRRRRLSAVSEAGLLFSRLSMVYPFSPFFRCTSKGSPFALLSR